MTYRNFIFHLSLLAVLFTSCVQSTNTKQRNGPYGGTLRINENTQIKSLFPYEINDLVSARIVSQIHLGLLKYDAGSLSVRPGIASDWDVDNSGTIYTFKINPNAVFQNDNCFKNETGRKITARDVKYSFELLAKKDTNSFVKNIKGGKEFISGTPQSAEEITGIEVLNDSVVEITLTKPSSTFKYHLANPQASILAKEAYEKYGTELVVGAGAFILNTLPAKGEKIILTRNPNYFLVDKKMNQLPYLDSVILSFASNSKSELRMLEEGELDIVMGLRSDHVVDFLGNHIGEFESKPPKYILDPTKKMSNNSSFNIARANVQNYYVNPIDNYDLSVVFFMTPNTTINVEDSTTAKSQ